MGQHSWIYTDTCNPYFWKVWELNPKRRATHKHLLPQSETLPYYACFSHFSFTPVYAVSQEEAESGASHYTYGKYVLLHLTVHVWKMSLFTNVSRPIWTGGQDLQTIMPKTCVPFFPFKYRYWNNELKSPDTMAAVRFGTKAEVGKFAPMDAIGPFCACPSRLCMSLGRLVVGPTAWFLRTRIASSSLSRRSSIRDWEDQRDWRVWEREEGQSSLV